MALAENPELSTFTGAVQDSGEGRWTIVAALEEAVPPVKSDAVKGGPAGANRAT